MTTTTEQLHVLGKKVLPQKSFLGVFARDQLPPYLPMKNAAFIVNTDTSNLPGQHWLACIVRNGEGFVFDPLGYSVPLMLVEWMTDNTRQWSSNLREIQPYLSNMCGYFCLHFLYHATAHFLKDEHFVNIINLIYPKSFSPTHYENSVMDFINVVLSLLL